jgi:hypothetical protein
VEVVEGEAHRADGGQPFHQGEHFVDDPKADVGRPRAGHDRGGVAAVLVQGGVCYFGAVGVGRAGMEPERIADHAERTVLRQLVGHTAHHFEPEPSGGTENLVEQTALAHARFTLDDHHTPRPPSGLLEQAADLRQFGGSTEEGNGPGPPR